MKTELVYFDFGNVICIDPDPHFFSYVSKQISQPVERIKEVFSKKFSPFVAGTISDADFFKFLAENLNTNSREVSSWFSTVYPPLLKPKEEILFASLVPKQTLMVRIREELTKLFAKR